ncbi:MAG: hypothetical protein ACXABY_02795 [Candidatus Thorarchaeota archaeon]|jgi:hypothetical protein
MLTNPIKEADLVTVRQTIQRLSSLLLGPSASPTFAGLTLTSLTPLRLVWSDSAKSLVSKDLMDLVAGTANKVTVTDDGSGGVVVTLPDALSLVNPTVSGTLDASSGEVLVEDNATNAPLGKSDGYVGVVKVDSDGRLYFMVEGTMYYVTGSPAPSPGNPMPWLFWFTYA